MDSRPLEESSLGLTADDIGRVFAPFVARECPPGDPVWAREIPRRRKKLVKQSVRRLLFGEGRRDEAEILNEYDRSWAANDYSGYDLELRPTEGAPWEWRDRRVLMPDVGGARFRLLLVGRVIQKLQPKSVLEVGCGNGLNLILLASAFPEVAFTGVELTEAGHRQARFFQERAALPPAMQAFAPFPIRDATAFRRVTFLKGSAAELPLADGSVDLAYTVLALEQMERIRPKALAELSRVARDHVLMIEPFRDVNRSLWDRLNVYRRDYFRGSIDELRRYGLVPELALHDFPQEAFLKVCLVLAKKAGST